MASLAVRRLSDRCLLQRYVKSLHQSLQNASASVKIPRCIEQFLENCLSDRKAVVVADEKFFHAIRSHRCCLSRKNTFHETCIHYTHQPHPTYVFKPYKFALNTSTHYLLRKIKKHHSINMPFLCVLLLIKSYKTLCFHHASTKTLQTFFICTRTAQTTQSAENKPKSKSKVHANR